MKNLENLKLQELTIDEQTNTNGGFFITGVIAGAVATAIIEFVASTFFPRRPR